MRKTLLFFTLLIHIAFFSQSVNAKIIPADHPDFQYTGRLDYANPAQPVIYWPGTSVTARFSGSRLTVLLDDTSGDNFYNVIIDNDNDNPFIIDCVQGQVEYPVPVQNNGEHTMLIFRRTEGFSGPTIFKGIQVDDGNNILTPPARPKHKIEFFGDSITCGMGNECEPDAEDENNAKRNNFLAYGAITARNLDAEYMCTAKSGIGIIISWFDFTMPDYYYRLNPADSSSHWDFNQWTPEIVVINLFQNDSWLITRLNPVPGIKEISAAYYDFIKTIRTVYPNAHIICTLGSMDATRADSPWPDYIQAAVNDFNKQNNDKVLTCFFDFDETGKHPRVVHHKAMAEKLTGFIKTNYGW